MHEWKNRPSGAGSPRARAFAHWERPNPLVVAGGHHQAREDRADGSDQPPVGHASGKHTGIVEDDDQDADDEESDDEPPHPLGADLGVLRDWRGIAIASRMFALGLRCGASARGAPLLRSFPRACFGFGCHGERIASLGRGPNPGMTPCVASTLVPVWGPGCWSSITTTRSSTTSSRSWANSEPSLSSIGTMTSTLPAFGLLHPTPFSSRLDPVGPRMRASAKRSSPSWAGFIRSSGYAWVTSPSARCSVGMWLPPPL